MFTNSRFSGRWSCYPRIIRKAFLIAVLLAASTAYSNRALAQSPATQPAAPDPGLPEMEPAAMVELAITKIDQGDLAEAERLLKRATVLKPTLDSINLGAGLLLIKVGRPSEAQQLLAKYTKSSAGQSDYRGLAAIGKIYLASSMFREARRVLKEAQRTAPAMKDGKPLKASLLLDLAMAEQKLKDDTSAMEHAREGARLAQNDAGVQTQYAQIMAAASKPDNLEDAIRQIELARQLVHTELQNDPFGIENLSLYRTVQTLFADTRQKRMQQNPDNTTYIVEYSDALRGLADIERRISLYRARAYLLQAIEMAKEPNLDWEISAAALELEIGGDAGFAGALERVRKVLEANPAHEGAKSLKSRIESSMTTPPNPA